MRSTGRRCRAGFHRRAALTRDDPGQHLVGEVGGDEDPGETHAHLDGAEKRPQRDFHVPVQGNHVVVVYSPHTFTRQQSDGCCLLLDQQEVTTLSILWAGVIDLRCKLQADFLSANITFLQDD